MIEAHGVTDVGRQRGHNEDSFLNAPELGLFVVCDGMGGHSSGEVASQMAVDTLRERVSGLDPERLSPAEASARLRGAIEEANRRVHAAGSANSERAGMGTTCTAILRCGSKAVLGHVGDSRAYLQRDGQVHLLSNDHTFVAEALRQGIITAEQAKNSPHGNIVTRAIGPQPEVLVDTLVFDLAPGDTILLCSDGLSQYFEPDELNQRLGGNVFALPEELVRLANERGGEDNITALILRSTKAEPQWAETIKQSMADLNALSYIHLLGELSLRERSDVVERMEALHFADGDLIVREDELSDSLFVLVAGDAQVERNGRVIATLSAGSHFGEMGLLNDRPRSATVRAKGSVRLLRLCRDSFYETVQRNPQLGVKFLWTLAQALSIRLDDAFAPAKELEEVRNTLTFGLYPSPFSGKS